MSYVLVIMLWGLHGVATTTHDFNSLEACETAGKTATEKWGEWGKGVRYSCTPKGDPK